MTLLREQPCETRRRAQLPRFRALLARDVDRGAEGFFDLRIAGAAAKQEQLTLQAIQLRLVHPLSRRLDAGECLFKNLESRHGLLHFEVSLDQHREYGWWGAYSQLFAALDPAALDPAANVVEVAIGGV